ncbi:hypothetical protein SFC23_17895 [Shouchella clausii]|uniref:hypothetical protein n=1 Tax=Shouchella clausii TaxID=79880 RepID=UPI003981E0A2
MTQYIYIASPMKLPQGCYGQKPISKDKPHIFKDELDFTHLFFERNYDNERKKRFAYSQHFSFKHQVAAYDNAIPLKGELTNKPIEEKLLTILYDYLEAAIHTSRIIEYFTSVNGEEDKPISRMKTVDWTDIEKPYDLVLADREFWQIILW